MSQTIQILGPGCPNCARLAENARVAVESLGLDCELVKVTSIMEIMAFSVISTPALALDGKILVSGRVPSTEEILKLLTHN